LVRPAAVDPSRLAGHGRAMRPSPCHSGDTAAALSRLARQAPPEEVLWQLEGLVRANLRPQIYHLNAVLNACGRTGDWRFAVDHLHKIVQHDLWPNKFSFSAAINACEKGNHWQVALALLASMPDWKVAADTVVFNTAISACGKSEHWEAALHLLHGMPDSLLEPDAVSFNAAIVACRNSWQMLWWGIAQSSTTGTPQHRHNPGKQRCQCCKRCKVLGRKQMWYLSVRCSVHLVSARDGRWLDVRFSR